MGLTTNGVMPIPTVSTHLPPNWYAVRTLPRHEKKVCTYFSDKNITFYCPQKRTLKQWSDRKKWVDEVLIPSFVFVHIEEHQKLEVLQTKSVINFLYWLKKPAIIKDKDIDILKRFLNDHAHCELIEEHLFDGDAVEITSGAFIGMKGTLDTLQGKVAHIQLPLLNRVYKFKIPSASIIKAV